MSRARVACTLLLALVAPNVGAQGATCRLPEPVVTLPIEVGQGGAGAGRGAPPDAPPLYLAAVRVAPTLGFQRIADHDGRPAWEWRIA